MRPAPLHDDFTTSCSHELEKTMNNDENTEFTDRRVRFDINEYTHFDPQQSPQETMLAGQPDANPETSTSFFPAGASILEDDGDATSSTAGSTLETFQANDDLEKRMPEEPDE